MKLIDEAAAYAASVRSRNRPSHVDELIVMNLVDWFAVVLGARDEPAGQKVDAVVRSWAMHGQAPLFSAQGGSTAPMGAALVNGTLAHCLDFDDLHFPSLAHLSAPTWAAIWAHAGQDGCDERLMMDAFAAGFEVAARLGANGVGQAVTDRGWHSTGVHGRISAVIAAGVMRGLTETQLKHAIAVAATQTSGLTTSFGTMAKPFHAGKAAADGVLAAELAAADFEGAPDILDAERSLASALVQDGSATMRLDGLYERYEIEANALKPYACCGLTHAAIDCARELAPQISPDSLTKVTVSANPLALKVANQRAPETPLAGKFSMSYCVSLGLHGFAATESDFASAQLEADGLKATEARVSVVADETLAPSAAEVAVTMGTGESRAASVAVSLGNPENPMTWSDLRQKFVPLVQNAIPSECDELFETMSRFHEPGRLAQTMAAFN